MLNFLLLVVLASTVIMDVQDKITGTFLTKKKRSKRHHFKARSKVSRGPFFTKLICLVYSRTELGP